ARVPGIGAFTGKQIDYCVVRFFRFQQLAAGFTEEDCDGHTPDALARDAPVRTGGDHVGDALFSPRGYPLYFLDLVQRALAQRNAIEGSFHRDEPLFRGTKDHRVMAAPAV